MSPTAHPASTSTASEDSHLPPGWAWATVGDTGEYINGYAFKPQHREDAGRPIIRIQNLTDPTKPLNRTTLDVPSAYHIATGEMLVSWSATVDVFVWNREPALVNQHIFRVVPNEKLVDKTFLFHWLKVAIDQLLISEHLHGSTMKHINRGPFMAHRIPLPPRSEQERIAQTLEELLSNLDAGVTELRTSQRKLAQYRQSLLKAAVEGALTSDWRAARALSGEPQESGADLLQRILTERRARWEAKQLAKYAKKGKTPPKGWQAKYSEPVEPDTTDLAPLPDEWVWVSLDALVSESSYGTSVKCSYESAETPVLRIPNVSAGRIDLRDMKHSIQALPLDEDDYLAVGDILVIRTNGSIGLVGRAAAVTSELPTPHYFASYLLRLRCVDRDFLHRWVSSVLAAPPGRQWLEVRAASSAGQHNISLSTLLTMPVPLPPAVEQSHALDQLLNNMERCAELQRATNLSLSQAAAQRQNILQDAFSGKLVPQDPSDEPASALLERIRASRAANAQTGRGKNGRKRKETT